MSRPSSNRGPFYESVLARNVRALIDHQAGGSVNAWARRYNLPQPTINRIYTGATATSVTVLLDMEEACGVAAWQLLHPAYDPRRDPPMHDPRVQRVAAVFAALSPAAQDACEALIEHYGAVDALRSAGAPVATPAPKVHQ